MEIVCREGQLAADFGTAQQPLSAVVPGHWHTLDDSYNFYLRDDGMLITGEDSRDAIYERVKPHMPSPTELADLAGIYDCSELATSYVLSQTSDQLWAAAGRTEPVLRRPANRHVMRLDGRSLSFAVDSDGQIAGFTLSAEDAWGFWFARRAVALPDCQ